MKQTKRYLNLKIETRENENNEKWIVGLIPYNSKSQNLNPNGKPFFEVIEKTAFNKTLGDGAEVRALFSHDETKVLGTTKNNTLILTNTEEGLLCECLVPNTSWGNDTWEIIKRGDITTMSFGFIPYQVKWTDNIKYLQSVRLFEVSFCVASPAYEETNSMISLRSLIDEEIEIEKININEVKELIEKLQNLINDSKSEIEIENESEKVEQSGDIQIDEKEIEKEEIESKNIDLEKTETKEETKQQESILKNLELLCEIELLQS